MRTIIAIFIFMFCISGCRTVKELNHQEKETRQIIQEIIRDTTVVIAKDSSWLRAWLECDSTGQVILKELLDYQAGKNISIPKIKIVDNVLTTKTVVDSFGIYLTLLDRYMSDTVIQTQAVERIVEVNKLLWWQKCLMYIGIIVILIFLYRLK